MTSATDSVLWYNVGKFGEAGYAVPNFGDDISTLNSNILDITNLIGRNVFSMMHSEDADLRTPPSINTLMRLHRLYVRAGQILQGRAVPSNVPMFETRHVTPNEEVFRVYPVPFFLVRNPFMKTWCRYALSLLSECFQHTENRREVEITESFSGMVGQYLTRIYSLMAIELFGKTADDCRKPGFLLADADFQAYSPGRFFTGTEMTDTVPPFNKVFTEDQLKTLSEGIPVTQLPSLGFWPGSSTPDNPATGASSSGGPIFPAPTIV